MVGGLLDDLRPQTDLCVFCPKLCRFACPVAEAENRETVTPWALVTRIDDARRDARPLDVEAAELWAHCTGCGRCTAVCKHDTPVFDLLTAVRGLADQAGLRPAAVTAWAAAEAPPSPAWHALPEGGDVQMIAGYADDAAIADAVTLLRAAGWAPGRGPRVTARREAETGDRATPDRPTADIVIALEAADAQWLRATWPTLRVVTLPEALEGRLPALRPVLDGDALYLDACRLGRGLGVYAAPRRLLNAVISGGIRESVMHHEQGGCCGAGGGYAAADPEGAAAAAREAIADIAAPLPVVIADPVCTAHLAAHAGAPIFRLSRLLVRALAQGDPS